MNKEFVGYAQALALKELGFDEPCFGYYNIDPQLKNPAFNMVKPFEHEWCLPAPTYSQAFRWFRDKHNLHVEIIWDRSEPIIWYYSISKIGDLEFEHISSYLNNVTKTPEEAEQAGLDKLIQIVKQK